MGKNARLGMQDLQVTRPSPPAHLMTSLVGIGSEQAAQAFVGIDFRYAQQ